MRRSSAMRAVVAALVPAFTIVPACSPDETAGPVGAERDAGAPTEELCDRMQLDTYVAGIEHASSDGQLTVKILDAIPAPPAVGDNDWTIQIGGARAAATPVLPVVEARSPLRNIGAAARSPIVTVIDAERRIFRVEKLLLAVPGPWEIAVRVSAPDEPDASAPPDVVVFEFCASS